MSEPTTRRSTRLAQKQATPKGPGAPSRRPPVATKSKLPNKRQKVDSTEGSKPQEITPVAPKRRGRGRLEGFADLPFDVSLEILYCLEPADLLNLSRSSKVLRSILLDRRTSEGIWEEAFASTDVPFEMFLKEWSPIMVARLLYDRECFECGDKVQSHLTTVWAKGERLCEVCFFKTYVPAFSYIPADEDEDHSPQRGAYLYKMVFKHIPLFGPYRGRKTYWPKGEYELHRAKLKHLRDGQYESNPYVQKHIQSSISMRLFEDKMIQWERKRRRDKQLDIDNRRSNRRNAYKARLAGLGYRDVLARLSTQALETLPAFKGAKPLTDKEWARLEPQIVEHMDEVRKVFAKQDRYRVISTRIYHLASLRLCYASRHRDEQVPSIRDIAAAEPFRTLIFDTPLATTVAEVDFIPLYDHIAGIARDWNDAAADVLLGLLPQQISNGRKASKKGKEKAQPPGRSVLHRATTLFNCAWCIEVLAYPNVLTHACLTKRHRQRKGEQKDAVSSHGEDQDEDEDEEPEDSTTTVCWNEGNDQLEFDEEASGYARIIIQACGMNPDTATFDDMDQQDARLECVRCRKPNSKLGRLTMHWRNAVDHELRQHSTDETKGGWQLLSEADTVVVKAKEDYQQGKTSNPRPPTYQCNECTFYIINNGVVVSPKWSAPFHDPKGPCPNGHDMSCGSTRLGQYNPVTFKRHPLPVKIA